jgi:conjugal transfer ATP-binding protein TraC
MIDHVSERLEESDDPRVRDVGRQLYQFCLKKGGAFGKFFNGPNTVDLDAPLVCVELQQLTGRPHLQRVVLLMIMYQIQAQMDSLPREMPKQLVVDEAFSLLAGDETKSFLIAWYRQLRKFGASCAIATQSVNDLYANSGTEAIVENSAHMWLLAQKAESIAMVKKESRMPMSDAAFRLLETVHTVPGEYSEIMVRGPYGVGIGRLVVPPFNLLLYSTKAEDVAARKAYMDRGLNVAQAIKAVMRDRAAGAIQEAAA